MNTQPEALRLADELFDGIVFGGVSIELAREAKNELRRLHEVNQMLVEAGEVALEILETDQSQLHWQAVRALRQALAQPKQEPALGLTAQANGVVARLYLNPTSPLGKPDLRVELPYSEIPACNPEWVGLTDEEVDALLGKLSVGAVDEDVRTIEAKLKEKNGG